MLARTVIYHDPYQGPQAMLVTKVNEDGSLDGTVFHTGEMNGEPVQGVTMAQDPENPATGTCTHPEMDERVLAAAQLAEEAQHKADLAATRSLEHQHKAEEAATKAEEAATKPAAKRTTAKK